MEETKACRKCDQELPITEFYKDKRNKDGYGTNCKGCINKRNKDSYYKNWNKRQIANKQYAQLHKEEIKEYQRKYKEDNWDKLTEYHSNYTVEHKEYKAEYDKRWRPQYYSENKDRILKYQSEHYQIEEFKNLHRESVKEWRKNNPDKVQIYKLKRRTLEKELPSTLTPDDWIKIKDCFGNQCAYCGREVKLTLDHFIPLTKLGELSINNSVPACLSCNSSKNNKDFFEWYPKQPFYSKKRERVILEFLGYDKQGVQQLALMI